MIDIDAARKRDVEKGRVDAVEELKTVEGRAKYATHHQGDFERLRKEIMERDKKRVKGVGVDSAIELD